MSHLSLTERGAAPSGRSALRGQLTAGPSIEVLVVDVGDDVDEVGMEVVGGVLIGPRLPIAFPTTSLLLRGNC